MTAFPKIDPLVLQTTGGDPKPEPPARSVPKQRPDETDWTKLRKAAPYNKLLDVTFRWADSLPPEIRPLTLMAKYPRLANMAAVSWKTPEAFRDYLDLLLVDRRGARKGFSPEILEEFKRLRDLRLYGVSRTRADPSVYQGGVVADE
jgi:hypothetical protein